MSDLEDPFEFDDEGPYYGYDDDAGPNLGMCCICLQEHPTVRNVLMLPVRAPVPGIGAWGCFECGLPMAGAVAVLCDNCLTEHIENQRPISLACVGAPDHNQRVPLVSLTEHFDHDMTKHAGEE